MAITGTFSPGSGILSLFGDTNSNSIILSRDAAGAILANGGAVQISGGTPTVANTNLIQVFSLGGDDTITLDESNGALPRANLFGGAGNDTMSSGSGADMLFGQAGNDVLLGKGGADFLFGGSGNDVLTGGDGDDQMFGEAGNDRMIWNPGDDSDLMEGGAGEDTAEINGGNGGEIFTIAANGTRVRFDRAAPGPFSVDIGTTENLVLNANGGDDMISATGNLATLIKLTIDGGAGNDTILGGNGNDTLRGGDGNDFIDGNQGNDTAFLGTGDDTFQWDPGDGNDSVEGEDGIDKMLFNGAVIGEVFDISANGERARLVRNIGNITMDLNEVERIDVNALGGADAINVGDMSGTDVTTINVNLAGTLGGTTGDGQADTVTVAGTSGGDTIQVLGQGGSVTVAGLSALVQLMGTEGANDQLIVRGGGGDDTISASALVADVIKLTIDGGAGNDSILGSRGDDTLVGDDGNDLIDGQQGNDHAKLGAGDDTFRWDPGDGSDTVEGQDGFDTLLFNGANISEIINISANGQRALFTRDIASITMDLNEVERIDFNALGGADKIVVNDMTGTDVTLVNLNLASTIGGNTGDGQADEVTVKGTGGKDTITVASVGSEIVVSGLPAETRIQNAEGALDKLVLTGEGGADVIDASGLLAGSIKVEFQGGAGADQFIGSDGDDLMVGGDGNDIALMGEGNDEFVWNPGDDNDTVDGQDGFDTLRFNGAIISESVEISANGSHASFARKVGNVTMDLTDVEAIQFNAFGEKDNVVVNDLSGTGVTEVGVKLAATIDGDGKIDTIVINATEGDDVIVVTNDNGVVRVLGLASEVFISNFDADDRIEIHGLGGDDVIEASGLGTAMKLTADGGEGDDVLMGSAGVDVLSGGAGDDVLVGGAGLDVLDGGPGDNVVIQGFAPLQPEQVI